MPLSLFVGVGVKGGGLALNRIGSWSSLKIAGEFQIVRYQLFVETSVDQQIEHGRLLRALVGDEILATIALNI